VCSRDQILDDLHLLLLGVLAGSDIEALDVGQLILGFHAAVAGQIEEGVVHGFGHQGKNQLVLRLGHDRHGQNGRRHAC
jgi:hypothetical protein